MNFRTLGLCVLFISVCVSSASGKRVRHYVLFGQDREAIKTASSFLYTEAFEGAQVTYSWRQLEPVNHISLWQRPALAQFLDLVAHSWTNPHLNPRVRLINC